MEIESTFDMVFVWTPIHGRMPHHFHTDLPKKIQVFQFRLCFLFYSLFALGPNRIGMILTHLFRKGLLRTRGKNKKQRALFVVDRLFDALCCYLNHPLSPHKKRAPLFPGQPDRAISNNRLQRIVKEQAKKAGIKTHVTPRLLRHSFATEMYHQNVPLQAIQEMMGHDSIADTSIYVHVSDKLKQLALDSIRISRRLTWQ